jgi:hypothetical protein
MHIKQYHKNNTIGIATIITTTANIDCAFLGIALKIKYNMLAIIPTGKSKLITVIKEIML